MNSLMSMRTMAFSSSNRNSASALHSSVFPTPVGPRNRNEPIGRFGSPSPARLRRTASDTARTASSWPITRLARRSSIFMSFSRSPSSIRVTGTPVQRETTEAISSGVTSSFTRASPLVCSRPQFRFGICDLGFEIANLAILNPGGDFPIPLPLRLFELDLLADRALPASFLIASIAPFSFSHRAVSVASLVLQLRQALSPPSQAVALLAGSFSWRSASISICKLHDPAANLIQLGGHRIVLDPQTAGRFVDQVDRLVGQKTILNVAVADSTAAETIAPSVMRTP